MATLMLRFVTIVYVFFPDFFRQCMSCCALSLCSLQGIRQTISRSNMRRQYDIKSNDCNDCLISWFCDCCALVQKNKQVKAQDKENEQHATSKWQPSMTYKQPQQQ